MTKAMTFEEEQGLLALVHVALGEGRRHGPPSSRARKWRDEPVALEEGESLSPLTETEEAELIAGFLLRKPALEVAFLNVLRPRLRRQVYCNFHPLWPQRSDLQQSAVLKVCELRENPREVWRICPPIDVLAKYLMDAPARVLARLRLRDRQMLPLEDVTETVPENQESRYELKRLLEIAATLPRGMAKTMIAHALHEMGEGPPLAEVLGIDHRSAQRRLLRAQAAVLRIARGEKVEVDDE